MIMGSELSKEKEEEDWKNKKEKKRDENTFFVNTFLTHKK